MQVLPDYFVGYSLPSDTYFLFLTLSHMLPGEEAPDLEQVCCFGCLGCKRERGTAEERASQSEG